MAAPGSTTTQQPTIGLLDPHWYRTDPQAAYRWLRAYDGLWHDEVTGLWAIARHADVLEVERRPELFSSKGVYRAVPSPEEKTMISQDDPGHLGQRRLINRRFTPRATKNHAEEYQNLITELVDGALVEVGAHGSTEVVHSLAAQLPCRVTSRLIGFGDEHWEKVQEWSEKQMRIDTRMVDEGVYRDLYESIHEWAALMQELLPQRMAEPQDDLFSTWLEAGMDFETMVQETGLLIAGGAETTRTVISHGLRLLADRPDEWERLAADSSSIPAAVEELVRYVTPLNNFFRIATEDVEVAGTTIPAGDRVILLYPAANRDESVFADPDTLDLTRDPNPHLSFGHGTHFCLGANLARVELRLLLEELTSRVTNLRVVNEPDVEPNIFARAVRSFDLAFDAR